MGTFNLIPKNIRHKHKQKKTMANKNFAAQGAAHQKKIKAMSDAERKAYFKKNAEKTAKSKKALQAGLQFPVNRMRRNLKKVTKAKVTKEAAIYAAAILEYCCAEVIELAGEKAIAKKKKRIMPRHVMVAIKGDEELNKLAGKVIIASAGSMPVGVHPSLKEVNLARKNWTNAVEN